MPYAGIHKNQITFQPKNDAKGSYVGEKEHYILYRRGCSTPGQARRVSCSGRLPGSSVCSGQVLKSFSLLNIFSNGSIFVKWVQKVSITLIKLKKLEPVRRRCCFWLVDPSKPLTRAVLFKVFFMTEMVKTCSKPSTWVRAYAPLFTSLLLL